MRRPLALAALAVAVALAAPAADAVASPGLAETAGARFPDRAYVVTLPQTRTLTNADVAVTENGRRVSGVEVVAPDAAGGARFGVVLAIDTSGSMHGRPLQAALQAARVFVSHRAADQPVAVLTFAGDVRVVVPFTTDAAAIDNGLATVAIGPGGSHVLDGAARGVDMLGAARMASGSVVLLSDGADHGSTRTLDQVVAAARSAGARVFAVGLHSGNVDFGALNTLAAEARGEFSPASSAADLTRIYDRLGARLAHQYVVRYRSGAAPGSRVDVEVRIRGVAGSARTAYRTPALVGHTTAPFRHGPLETFWLTPGAAALLALFVSALIAAGAWLALRPRGPGVRGRIAVFVSPPEEDDAGQSDGLLGGRLLRGAERSLEGRAWWTAFKERMDVARVEMAPARLLTLVTAGTLALLFLAPVVLGSPVFVLLAVAVPVGAKAVVEHRCAKQRKLFGEQLPDNLQVIASAMRAGHSFGGALSVVVEDAQEPTRRELQRVIADERLGVSLEDALAVVVRRMDSADLEQVSLVAALQRETGGNTAEVLDQVTETVRQRMALQRTVNTLTAQGRISRWVLTALPIVLLAAITVVSPTYVAPLYGTLAGRVLLGVAAGMVAAGSLVIKRIVNIKV